MPKLLTTIGNKTKSVTTSISLTNHQQLPPPPPPPTVNDKQQQQQQKLLSNNDNKSTVTTTTPKIICTKSIATTSNSIDEAGSSKLSSTIKNYCCTTCSSIDINEINVKIKSCQNCNQINIDELSYSYNKKQKNSSTLSTTPSTTTNTVQACYYQLANITRKLKSIYKNRINQTTTTTPLSSQNSSLNGIDENNLISVDSTTETSSKDYINKHNYCQQHQNYLSTKINQNIESTSSNVDKKLHDDVLVLRICDLDNKLKLSNNTTTTKNNYITTTGNKNYNNYEQHKNFTINCKDNDIQNNINNNKKYLSPIINKNNNKSIISDNSIPSNTNSNTITTSPNIKIIGKNKIIRSFNQLQHQNQHKLNNKNSRKLLKSLSVDHQSTNTATTSINNNNKSMRKIIVISDEYKKKSENLNDIQINCSIDRKEIMKKFRQNNEISKSLDIILPSQDLLINDNLNSIINPPPYIFTSKSTSNLNDENNINYDDDDDDDGPFESINSVELIFISDEFLNKAIKHDLKILKNNTKKPIINNGLNSLDNQINNIDIKLNKPKIKLDSSTTILKNNDENCNRKNSISPKSSSITPSGGGGGGGRGSNNSQKKLIIISEDFKRKSLENNIVIINDNNINNHKLTKLTTSTSLNDYDKNDDITAATQISNKRKTIKDLKLTRQSSIDDVGNQMLSHAFCSAEEPDEQCLESKEIITTPE